MHNLGLYKKASFLLAPALFCLSLGLASTAITGCRGLAVAPQSVTASTGDFKTSVNHIVIMVQENRSFDQYFGKLNDYRVAQGLGADVDGIPPTASNMNFDNTAAINAFHLITACTENPSPSWNESHVDINRNAPESGIALMDGFALTAGNFSRHNNGADIQGVRAMGYYTDAD